MYSINVSIARGFISVSLHGMYFYLYLNDMFIVLIVYKYVYIYVQGDVYIMLRRVYISSFVYRLARLLRYEFRLCASVCV